MAATDYLFAEGSLEDYLEQQKEQVCGSINAASDDLIYDAKKKEGYYNYLIKNFRVEIPRIDEPPKVHVRKGGASWVYFHIYFGGNAHLLQLQPFPSGGAYQPRGTVKGNEIIIPIERSNRSGLEIRKEFDKQLEKLKNHLKQVENEVGKFNEDLTEISSEGIKFRQEEIEEEKELIDSIGYPVKRN